MIIDNESEAGSWEREMRRAPWAFGQRQEPTIAQVIYKLRALGLDAEAQVIEREFSMTKRLDEAAPQACLSE